MLDLEGVLGRPHGQEADPLDQRSLPGHALGLHDARLEPDLNDPCGIGHRNTWQT
jgi:hypothetical protein